MVQTSDAKEIFIVWHNNAQRIDKRRNGSFY